MAAQVPPAPANPTGEFAHNMAGYDPAPAIVAQEQSLQDFLNLPVKEILARLGLSKPEDAQRDNEGEPRPEEQQPEQPQANPFDPSALISPVTDALGTLGSGLFEGTDPLAMLQGISQAFQATGGNLAQSLGAVDDSWQGASGSAAAAKTAAAVSDGARVAEQSEMLRNSLTTASTDVAQARARIVAIITEFQATLAAIGPNIIFPWGWAAAIAAANKAIASTAEVITELQSSLGAQAAQVTAAGAPVGVTAAPAAAGASPFASIASPLMSMATKGAQAGIQAATGAAGQAASQAEAESATTGADSARAAAGGGAAAMAPLGGKGGGGVGGGGFGGSPAVRSFAASPMVQPESAPTQPATVRATAGGGAGGGGMMGAPYAPMAGAGQGANSSNSHTAATFLHTTDKGGEIVGDLGNTAPPVLGAPDPNEPPDVELRI
nr:hypothetical protein [Mycolicibacterium komanii]CRL74515.1 NPL/P60-family protein membrane protein [Mycolicibacterium komanii]